MKIFDTASLDPKVKLGRNDASWIYNGLDCCVTLEVRDKLREHLEQEPDNVKETYHTAMRKLAPVNYMCITGLRRDEAQISRSLTEYKVELRRLNEAFDAICEATIGYTVNWRSPPQLNQLFYTTFGLKPIRKRNAKGYYMPTTNADALEKLSHNFYAQVYTRYILAMREVGKRISFLETEVDEDGRHRTSLNIAGTDTGRFSSSFSGFGTGGNLQNVEQRLRVGFTADSGYILVNVDLEQADARNVGARIYHQFYDSHGPEAAGKYLDACESGDLHTTVCSMAWSELDWPDPWNLEKAREIADALAYRDLSYRDMSKKLGHGTNYLGTPPTMAMHTKTEVAVISQFQKRYFTAFPLIGKYDPENRLWAKLEGTHWHGWVYDQLRDMGQITTLFGRRRFFFDRYKDPNTVRAAIAYEPQSLTGEELDRGWLQLWDGMPEAKLKLPVHDSIMFQVPIEGVNELIPAALKLLRVELELAGGRIFSVPLEAKVGYNWGDAKKDKKTGLITNEYGLQKWTGKEERQPPRIKTRLRHYLS